MGTQYRPARWCTNPASENTDVERTKVRKLEWSTMRSYSPLWVGVIGMGLSSFSESIAEYRCGNSYLAIYRAKLHTFMITDKRYSLVSTELLYNKQMYCIVSCFEKVKNLTLLEFLCFRDAQRKRRTLNVRLILIWYKGAIVTFLISIEMTMLS